MRKTDTEGKRKIHFVLGPASKSGGRCEGLAACWSWCRWQQAAPPASGLQASSCCAPGNWRQSGWRVGAEGALRCPAGVGAGSLWMFPKPQPGLMLTWLTSASSSPILPTPSCHDFPAVILGLSPTRVPAFGGGSWNRTGLSPKLSFLPTAHPTLIFPFAVQVQHLKVVCAFRPSTRVQGDLPVCPSPQPSSFPLLSSSTSIHCSRSRSHSCNPPYLHPTGTQDLSKALLGSLLKRLSKAFPAYSRIRSGPSYFVSFISSLNPTGSLWPKQPGHLKLPKVHRAIMPTAGPPHSLLPSPRWDIPCLLSPARGMEREGGIHKNSQAGSDEEPVSLLKVKCPSTDSKVGIPTSTPHT